MNTQELMEIALQMAGMKEMPMDTGIQNHCANVKKILAGIDMGPAEVFAAHQMGYDCVVRHHGLESNMPEMGVMICADHIANMVKHGIAPNLAEGVMSNTYHSVNRRFHASNLSATSQMAKLVNIGLMGIHTPSDLLAERTVQKHMDDLVIRKPDTRVGDIIEELHTIREYRETEQGPAIWVGKPENRTGKILVIMSGGISPEYPEFREFIKAGYGTFVLMHLFEESERLLSEDKNCNVVVAGHMASDSIGLNTILDRWEIDGKIEIDRIGGLV